MYYVGSRRMLVDDVVWALEKIAISYAREDSYSIDGVLSLPNDSYNRGATHALCHAIALLINSRDRDLPMNEKQKEDLNNIKKQIRNIAHNMNQREKERATLD